MTKAFNDFCYAYNYLKNNPVTFMYGCRLLSFFDDCLYINIKKVNPKTNKIDEDESKNIKNRVFLEFGPYKQIDGEWQICHDVDLDVSADTFEKAIVLLANKVREKYDYDFVYENKDRFII